MIAVLGSDLDTRIGVHELYELEKLAFSSIY